MIDHDVRPQVAEPVRSTRHRGDGDGWTGLVLGAALVAMGLVAGLIYTFSVAVMPNLADADDRTFVATMQRFNQNPVFQVTFTMALVLTGLAVALLRRHGPGDATRWTVAALVRALFLHGRSTADPTVAARAGGPTWAPPATTVPAASSLPAEPRAHGRSVR